MATVRSRAVDVKWMKRARIRKENYEFICRQRTVEAISSIRFSLKYAATFVNS